MSKQLIIGLYGKAQSGKTTAAKYLEENFGLRRTAFARPMKLALIKVFTRWTPEHFEDSKLKDKRCPHYGVSPRHAMQTFGSEWGRDRINKNLWLLTAKDTIDFVNSAMNPPYAGVVFEDIRMPNEAELVRSEGGIVIEIQSKKARAVLAHRTEDGVPIALVDVIINNNGTKDFLYDELYGAVANHMQKGLPNE